MANINNFENKIQQRYHYFDAKLYSRYVDDILRDIKKCKIDDAMNRINDLDTNLKFTLERECNGSIPFLDMRIIRNSNALESTWYTKSTDTGLLMNFHALAPLTNGL